MPAKDKEKFLHAGVLDEKLDDGISVGNTSGIAWTWFNNVSHYHTFYELTMVYKGNAILETDDRVYNLSAGSVHLAAPNNYHVCSATEEFCYYYVKFEENVIAKEIVQLLQALDEPLVVNFPKEKQREAVGWFSKLFNIQESTQNTGTRLIELKLRLQLLLLECLRMYGGIKKEPDIVRRRDDVIADAILYTRRHYRENFSLKDIADYCSRSPNHFCNLFKASMKISYWQYLTNYRLDIAKKAVLGTDEPIAQIAYNCGFNSYNNFLRTFKNRFGVSPLQMRKQNSK